jgi:hypothetical protein
MRRCSRGCTRFGGLLLTTLTQGEVVAMVTAND